MSSARPGRTQYLSAKCKIVVHQAHEQVLQQVLTTLKGFNSASHYSDQSKSVHEDTQDFDCAYALNFACVHAVSGPSATMSCRSRLSQYCCAISVQAAAARCGTVEQLSSSYGNTGT